jgi:hypothetical protein
VLTLVQSFNQVPEVTEKVAASNDGDVDSEEDSAEPVLSKGKANTKRSEEPVSKVNDNTKRSKTAVNTNTKRSKTAVNTKRSEEPVSKVNDNTKRSKTAVSKDNNMLAPGW